MPTIQANGVSLYYEEQGTGAPILGVHGTGSSAAFWSDAAAELGRRGRAIVYDRRGFSRSERPDPFVTDVRKQADDAAALIDALGAAPVVAIGRSQGGEIAVDLALRYPERVRALALLEGGSLSLSPAVDRWLAEVGAAVFAAAETDLSTVGETMIDAVLGNDAWAQLPTGAQRIFTENGAAIVAEHRGGLADVTVEQLGTIRQPTLVVGAASSHPAFAEAAELLGSAIPSARVEWVEGDHLIDAAHPAVLAFVDEVLALR